MYTNIFDNEELLKACEMSYGLTLGSTRELAYVYAMVNLKTVLQSSHDKKRAEVEWMNSFRKRYSTLTLRNQPQ